MRYSELIIEEDGMPLWASIIQRGLANGHPFYFASGANRIWDIQLVRQAGSSTINVRLEHTTRKANGSPHRQTYTVWEKNYSHWTLKKFKDGHALRMTQPESAVSVSESADDPVVVSMFRKLIAEGKKIFFENRAGRLFPVAYIQEGYAANGSPAWHFYRLHDKRGGAVTWKTGDNINKLKLRKAQNAEHWILYDSTIVVREGDEMPFIVKLMNNRLEKQGAVKVDILFGDPGVAGRKRLIGWITAPLRPSGENYKAIVQRASSNLNMPLFFGPGADARYTLKSEKDGNGNRVMKVVDREAT